MTNEIKLELNDKTYNFKRNIFISLLLSGTVIACIF